MSNPQEAVIREEVVGEVGIDTGTLLLVDPVNVAPGAESILPSWDELLEELSVPGHSLQLARSLAVIVKDFGGDGNYPVVLRRDREGKVTEVAVRFR